MDPAYPGASGGETCLETHSVYPFHPVEPGIGQSWGLPAHRDHPWFGL